MGADDTAELSPKGQSRRHFLKGAGAALASIAIGGAVIHALDSRNSSKKPLEARSQPTATPTESESQSPDFKSRIAPMISVIDKFVNQTNDISLFQDLKNRLSDPSNNLHTETQQLAIDGTTTGKPIGTEVHYYAGPSQNYGESIYIDSILPDGTTYTSDTVRIILFLDGKGKIKKDSTRAASISQTLLAADGYFLIPEAMKTKNYEKTPDGLTRAFNSPDSNQFNPNSYQFNEDVSEDSIALTVRAPQGASM